MTNEERRDKMSVLRSKGFLDYGSFISDKEFKSIFGIETIDSGTFEEFKAIEIEEMACSGFVRDMLLDEGKYFKSEGRGYRVLTASENAQQVLTYMKHADNKLKRGLKLNKNTPSKYKISHEEEVRMTMKKESKDRF